MLKKLGKYMKGLGFLSLISALGMIIEAVCELALPSLANNIYETVNVATSPDQTKAYVLKMGFCMLGLAVIGLCGGLTTMKASAVVSQRFAFRLRNDVYRKISNFSFRNIDKFSTASLTPSGACSGVIFYIIPFLDIIQGGNSKTSCIIYCNNIKNTISQH